MNKDFLKSRKLFQTYNLESIDFSMLHYLLAFIEIDVPLKVNVCVGINVTDVERGDKKENYL
jgi:hypothetical protein